MRTPCPTPYPPACGPGSLCGPLRLAIAGALAIDAYVHADLATRYDPNQGTAVISQGDLFRIEAAVSALAALTVILTARRASFILAALVAASALGGLLLYRYFNPGALGPLPDMYEPFWYGKKTLTAFAEAAATITALTGCVIASTRAIQRRHRAGEHVTGTGRQEPAPAKSRHSPTKGST